MSSILLASGGMDSTTLAYWLDKENKDFTPLFINYGQHCVKTEYETLIKVLPPHLVNKIESIDVSGIYNGSSSRMIVPADLWKDKISAGDLYLPYRNLLILTIGAIVAQKKGYLKVYAAFINSNHAKEIDCSNSFFSALEPLLSDYGSVKIEMPFRELSKFQVAQLGINLQAPIGYTFSCQASVEIPCGACPNCVDRLEALRKMN
jgi:7-cyano-7-deazaguanine synthase